MKVDGNMNDDEIVDIENLVVDLGDGMKQLCLPITQMPETTVSSDHCAVYHHWLQRNQGGQKRIYFDNECDSGNGVCYSHPDSKRRWANYFMILTKTPIKKTS